MFYQVQASYYFALSLPKQNYMMGKQLQLLFPQTKQEQKLTPKQIESTVESLFQLLMPIYKTTHFLPDQAIS